MRQWINTIVLVTLVLQNVVFGLPTFAEAAINKQVNYQGKLTNTAGVAVSNAGYNVRFKLYTQLTLGTEIWSETWCFSPDSGATCNGSGTDSRITATSGLFSTMLGSTTALTSVDFNQTLYLGVEIGGSASTPVWDGEMAPRKKIGAVPAAVVAEQLNGLNSSQFLRSDAVNATSTASTFLTVTQTSTGDIARFIGQASTNVFVIKSGGNVAVGTTTPYSRFSVWGAGTGTGQLLELTNNASTTVARFLDDGTAYFSGNVGIGSTTPYAKLSVVGDVIASRFTATSSTKSTPNYTFIEQGGTGSLGWWTNTTDANPRIYQVSGGTAWVMFDRGSINVGAGVGNTPSLGFTDGNPDIQGSDATIVRDAANTIAIRRTTTAQAFKVYNTYTSDSVYERGTFSWSGNQLNIGTENAGGGTARSLNLITASTTRLTVDSGGNVGIGTTSPSARLAVHGSGYISSNLFVGGTLTSTSTSASTFPYASTTALTASGTADFGNLLVLGSTTLQNFTALNATTSQATTTRFAISGVTSALLKTNPLGAVIAAIAGTDYLISAITSIGPVGQLQTGVAQTLATSTTGTDFTITAAANTITFNLPIASATNIGKLSTTDWSTFNNKVSSSSLSGGSVISYTGATGVITTTGGTFGAGNYIFPGELTVTSSTTLQNFTALNATTTNATSTSLFATVFKATNATTTSLAVTGSATSTFGGAVRSTCFTTDGSTCITTGAAGGTNSKWATSSAVATSIHTNGALNVGIGSTSPFARLSVHGGATDTYVNTLFSVASSTAAFATSTHFVVMANGNVGVGTTTPYGKLSVNGTTASQPVLVLRGASGQSANLTEWQSSTGSTLLYFDVNNIFGTPSQPAGANPSLPITLQTGAGGSDDGSSGTGGAGGNLSFLGGVGGAGIGPASGGVGANLYFTAGNGGAANTGGGPASGNGGIIEMQSGFSGAASGGATAGDSGYITLNATGGNIGIGEATPAALLTVGSGDLFQINSSGLVFTPNGSAATPSYSFVSDTNTGLFGGSDVLGFTTAGTERMRITSIGNVGIGTTSPSARLAVHGSGYISSNLFVGGTLTSTSTSASTFPYASTTALTASGTADFGNLLVLGSTTLQNFTALNATTSQATTTRFAISGVTSALLKTNPLGAVIAAIAGTDYLISAITSIGPVGQLQTGVAQTLATSTTGTDFTITAAANTITFNLPIASATNIGKLSTTDWSTFNNKVSSSSLSGGSVISYTGATGVITTTGGTFGAGNYIFPGELTVTSSTTLQNFTALNATTTNATSTSLFATVFKATNATTTSLAVTGSATSTFGGAVRSTCFTTDGSTCITTGAAGGTNSKWATSSAVATSIHTNGALNVGIGSTSPFARLSVHGGATDTYVNTLFSVASSTAAFATSTHFVVMANGNVGVGTTTPYGKLSIVGNGTGSGVAFVLTDSAATPRMILQDNGSFLSGTTTRYARFTIQANVDEGVFALIGNTTQTANMFEIKSSVGANISYMSAAGNWYGSSWNHIGGLWGLNTTGLQLGSNMDVNWSSGAGFGSDDVGLSRSAVGILKVTDGSSGSGQLFASRLSAGSSTPWALLSVNPVAGNTMPAFVIGSSSATNFIVDTNGNVGIGTTSPYARLSIMSNQAAPQLVIATSSDVNPLFFVSATTTGAMDWARVAIGTTTTWGASSGLRDQFTVAGRIYSTWRQIHCDVFGAGQAASTGLATDTSNFCGNYALDADTDGRVTVQTVSNPSFARLEAGFTTSALNGEGIAFRTWNRVTVAAENPVIETQVKLPSASVNATSTILLVGFYGATGGANTGTLPPDGIYFSASTTNTWIAVTRNTNADVGFTNTGIATSTSFQRLRIEAGTSEVLFIINGGVVARHTTSIPTETLAPAIVLGVTGNGTTVRQLDVSYFKTWIDDPTGEVFVGSGDENRDFEEYDKVTGAEIATAYLADDVVNFTPGSLVSIDEEGDTKVRLSRGVTDNNLFGVVSTASREVLGNEDSTTIRVATTGRVPVTINTENGPIKPGDYITSSSVIGVGAKMKATGMTVGRAVSAFDGVGTSTVMVAIQPQYYNGAGFATNSEYDTADDDGLALLSLSNPIGGMNNSGAWVSAGDARQFSNVSDSSYGLSELLKLPVRSFTQRTSSQHHVGMIAQDLESIFPAAVDMIGGVRFVNYGSISALTVSALQDMSDILGIAPDPTTGTLASLRLDAIELRLTQIEQKIGAGTQSTGFTLFDEENGQPYCLRVRNGQMLTQVGDCSTTSTSIPPVIVENPTLPGQQGIITALDNTVNGSSTTNGNQTAIGGSSTLPTVPPTPPPTPEPPTEPEPNPEPENPENEPPPAPEPAPEKPPAPEPAIPDEDGV